MRKVRVITPGDTDFLPGSLINKHELKEENNRFWPKMEKLQQSNQKSWESLKLHWLQIVSFLQHPSRRPPGSNEAALEGKVDRLLGLKENVIIGQLIPAELVCAGIERLIW